MGCKITGKHLFYSDRLAIDAMLPAFSLTAIVICMNIIRIAHMIPSERFGKLKEHWKIWIARCILVTIMLIISCFGGTINQGVVVFVIIGCFGIIVGIDVEGRERRKEAKEEAKEKAEEAHHRETNKYHTEFHKHMKRMKSKPGVL